MTAIPYHYFILNNNPSRHVTTVTHSQKLENFYISIKATVTRSDSHFWYSWLVRNLKI